MLQVFESIDVEKWGDGNEATPSNVIGADSSYQQCDQELVTYRRSEKS